MTRPPVLDVFIGYDRQEIAAYHVLCQSLIETSSRPVRFTPINLNSLDGRVPAGADHRPVDRVLVLAVPDALPFGLRRLVAVHGLRHAGPRRHRRAVRARRRPLRGDGLPARLHAARHGEVPEQPAGPLRQEELVQRDAAQQRPLPGAEPAVRLQRQRPRPAPVPLAGRRQPDRRPAAGLELAGRRVSTTTRPPGSPTSPSAAPTSTPMPTATTPTNGARSRRGPCPPPDARQTQRQAGKWRANARDPP